MTQTVPPVDARSPERLEYHRLYRGQAEFRWWKGLVAAVLSAVFILVASSSVLLVFAIVEQLTTGQPLRAESAVALDAADPMALLQNLTLIAIWTPCILLALWVSGIKPVGRIHSVSFGLRWRWMLSCLVPAFGATAVMMLIGAVIIPAIIGEPLVAPSTPAVLLAQSLLVIVIVVPLQAAAEEYVFRGLLAQLIGAWIPWRTAGLVLALVAPTLVFALAHNYDIWGLLDVAIFGITAAWVTWRTGGLEAAIVLHAVNNVVLFAVMSTGANGSTSVQTETGGPIILIGTAAMMVTFALWIDRLRRNNDLATTAAPSAPAQRRISAFAALAGGLPLGDAQTARNDSAAATSDSQTARNDSTATSNDSQPASLDSPASGRVDPVDDPTEAGSGRGTSAATSDLPAHPPTDDDPNRTARNS
ncbi:CPBP family glutamic-type intramembrane protease [Lysinibacter cavernae]|uniref:Membrane protease YdiL (CAAX protease family) n=1 Tax=Lysinibacter cavernae TaxID=1640652 RepID=A0A7X5R3Z8_9MICO|nr:CPBP family glutamic-type intramembrane protease [Lysinibacter cavernae]NIH54890.1 membrane protease YdiL (CAAX protease family) [Lysinibacter cavernae]